jgi:hypothetical protein
MLIGRNLTVTIGPDPGLSGFDYPLAPRMFWLQLPEQR